MKFIGPTPEQINKMGDKITAKDTMKKAGVPVIPGSDGLVESIDDGKKIAGCHRFRFKYAIDPRT